MHHGLEDSGAIEEGEDGGGGKNVNIEEEKER